MNILMYLKNDTIYAQISLFYNQSQLDKELIKYNKY